MENSKQREMAAYVISHLAYDECYPQPCQIKLAYMRIVKMNLAFTTVYNLVGLSLAAFGFLPPALAAAAQSLSNIGIMGNSA